ncbi:hypothetical protein ACIPVK_13890 [Paeniglutamicibacter sp. MACA_103]|uniref:hypothetical protein n=1 Tax=Paeniglutamicibacter sp. MACA_103 TaxID=3377337 RepID=UPI0038964F22
MTTLDYDGKATNASHSRKTKGRELNDETAPFTGAGRGLHGSKSAKASLIPTE